MIHTRIVPCLWFDDQAEEAARYYTGIFPGSKITAISRYPEAGREVHGKAPGSVMTVSFELAGQPFTGLNGGPHFQFNEAVSLQVMCETQEEIDRYWDALGSGGDPQAQVCGWLKDRYGLSWQVVPVGMEEMLADETSPGAQRAMQAMLQMKKIDLGQLQQAYEGRLAQPSPPSR
jgi:predicted 3-demethylubiquinone-9 3-methyltransferase (glyoxalase superfamily)